MDDVGASRVLRDCSDLQVDAPAIRTDVQRHAIPDVEGQDVVSEDVQGAGAGNAVVLGAGEENLHGCMPHIMADTNREDQGTRCGGWTPSAPTSFVLPTTVSSRR